MSFSSVIRCINCNEEYTVSDIYFCPKCSKPDKAHPYNNTLEILYDYDKMASEVSKSQISSRRASLWRYKELLPIEKSGNILTLDEGFTPLRRCKKLGEYFGMNKLYIKDETVNPTSCHKDREASVLISKAVEWGRDTVSAFTCGNLGASLAAYATKAGLRSVIFIPYLDYYPIPRIAQMIIFNAILYKLSGTQEIFEQLATKLHKQYGWVFSVLGGGHEWEGKPQSPYSHEGKKTIGLEIVEQLGWRYPDHVLSVGAGGNFYDSWRAFKEIKELDWAANELPRMYSVESSVFNPTSRAFKEKKQFMILRDYTTSIAYPIASTVSPAKSLSTLRESNGLAVDVTDDEILQAQKLLANKEGVFVEPASACSIAGLTRLVEQKCIDKDETTVCIVTATGLKYPDIVTDKSPEIHTIESTIDSLKKIGIIK